MTKKYIIKPDENGYFTFHDALYDKYKILYVNGSIPINLKNSIGIWDFFAFGNQTSQHIIPKGYYSSEEFVKLLNQQVGIYNGEIEWSFNDDRFVVFNKGTNTSIVVNKNSRIPMDIEYVSIQYGIATSSTLFVDSVPNSDLAITSNKILFKFVKGLVGNDTISIITPDNQYIVHNGVGNNISAQPFEDTIDFKNRATFYEKLGFSDDKVSSFESYNIPNYHIHVEGSVLKLKNVNDATADLRCLITLPNYNFTSFGVNNFIKKNQIPKSLYLNIDADNLNSVRGSNHFRASAFIVSNSDKYINYKNDINYNQFIQFNNKIKKIKISFFTDENIVYEVKNPLLIIEEV